MESKAKRNQESMRPLSVDPIAEYREAVRKQLNNEVKKIIDLDMQQAVYELLEERKNAIRQVGEEYRTLIQQIVREEKEEIWKKAEMFQKSLVHVGL
jgi:hypothetical protein